MVDQLKPRKPWRTVEDVERATARWVDGFHLRRLYEYCGLTGRT
jgi:putative transposase